MKKYNRETFVRKFFKEKGLPFPVQREDFLPYYAEVENYENILTEFHEYICKVEETGYTEYIQEKDFFEEKMVNYLKNHPKYVEFLEQELPNTKIEINENMRKTLYKEDLIGNYYISIDLNNANFYMLYKQGIVDTPDYSKWIKTFTNNDLLTSKQVRQVLLGKLNNKRLERLMSLEMYNFIRLANEKGIINKNDVVVFNKDEVVYRVDCVENVENVLKTLQESNIFENCSFDVFKLEKTKYGFVKEYLDNTYSFHTVPKKYWMENYKLYKGLEVLEKDFMYLDEDRNLCLRLESKK